MKKVNVFLMDSDNNIINKSFYYLLGFEPSLGVIFLDDNSLTLLVDSRYFNYTKNIDTKLAGKRLNKNIEVKFELLKGDISKAIISKSIEYKKIELEKTNNYEVIEKLQKKLGNKINLVGDYFEKSRLIKQDDEIKYIRKAIKIINQVWDYIVWLNDNKILEGKTENYLRGVITQKIFEYGGEGESFDSIVASGEGSSIPHHKTSDKIIERGALLVDMGALYKGYCSDFTRTLWVGEEKDTTSVKVEEFKKIQEIVQISHNKALKEVREGIKCSEIDKAAREYIKSKGYYKYFTHGTGHGVGLNIHEAPSISSKRGNTIVNKGMVFTIEPGIYLEGKFGIRYENIVIVK